MHRYLQTLVVALGLLLVSVGLPVRSQAAAPNVEQESTSGSESSEDSQETPDDDAEASSSQTDSDEPSTPSGSSDDADSDSSKTPSDSASKRRESAHGSYEWKPYYGGGLSYGLFFSGLDRWNLHLLEPNDAPTLDVSTVSAFRLAAEASLIEGNRLTLFAGFERPLQSNPDVLAVYGGLEPAFAFRREQWELALGIGVGIGSVQLSTDDNREFSAGLVTLRPVLELRRYIRERFAAYIRIGFNQWLPFQASSDSLDIRNPQESRPDLPPEQLLYEGGFFTSLGVRFGYYPDPVRRIPDSEGDGIRDDVDDCVQKEEDKDGYKDYDGCPDPDNDGDGIEDDEDECPDEPEDIDQFEDEDGCPDEAADIDGDGIIDANDAAPKYAEDKDGFEDEDGAPDPDNDGDGIEDENDECPDEIGIESENGCPSSIVTVQEERLLVEPALQFQVPDEDQPDSRPGSTLTDDSKEILDEVAAVLQVREQLVGIEIQGHTAEGDDNEAMTKLSTARAEAVRSHLIDAGVSADRLTARGYGFSKPVEPEDGTGDTDPQPKARIVFVITRRSSEEDASKEGDETSNDSASKTSPTDTSESNGAESNEDGS